MATLQETIVIKARMSWHFYNIGLPIMAKTLRITPQRFLVDPEVLE
jgi:hypothetical protein